MEATCDKLQNGTVVLQGFQVLHGHFDPQTPPVSFYWRQEFTHAYTTTREEALRVYEHSVCKLEYTTSMVIVPTLELKMIVRFPPTHSNLTPEPRAIVFIGNTDVVHNEESDWGTMQVSMSRYKGLNTPLINLLRNHPNLFPILKMLLQI